MGAKVLGIGTNKGGEGKTFGAISLAEYSAIIQKRRTLLIDLDPQGNTSSNYLPTERDPAYLEGKRPPIHPDFDPAKNSKWDGRSSIGDIFFGNDIYPYPTRFPNLEICASHALKLLEAERVTKAEIAEKVHRHFKKFIQLPQIQNNYDLIVIDTPPSKGPLTVAAIKACSHFVIPSQMEEDSIDGIYGIMQLWKQEVLTRQPNDPIELVGIFANKVRSVSIHKSYWEQLQANESIRPYLLEPQVSQRIKYAEIRSKDPATKQTSSIFELSENDEARKEVQSVCEAIMRKIYHHG